MRIASWWPGLALLCAMSVCGVSSAATFTTIYKFCSSGRCPDGEEPRGPLIVDDAGNLYGTANMGGANNSGVVFELVPDVTKTVWTEKVLYNFCVDFPTCSDGAQPVGGLIRDVKGNIYGVAQLGGTSNYRGVAYELVNKNGGADWQYRLLHAFARPTAPTANTPAARSPMRARSPERSMTEPRRSMALPAAAASSTMASSTNCSPSTGNGSRRPSISSRNPPAPTARRARCCTTAETSTD